MRWELASEKGKDLSFVGPEEQIRYHNEIDNDCCVHDSAVNADGAKQDKLHCVEFALRPQPYSSFIEEQGHMVASSWPKYVVICSSMDFLDEIRNPDEC
jgi:hypothetical protein